MFQTMLLKLMISYQSAEKYLDVNIQIVKISCSQLSPAYSPAFHFVGNAFF